MSDPQQRRARNPSRPELTDRQRAVLRALVAAYVGTAGPVGSATISHLLSVKLSSASIRNTLAELSEMGLLRKPHASAGRVPTDEGLRLFVDRLLEISALEEFQRRSLDRSFDETPVADAALLASQVLSNETRQLGFVVEPRLHKLVLRQVTFVRLTGEKVLAVLVDASGIAHQCVIDTTDLFADTRGSNSQAELDRISTALNEWVAGRTLPEVRDLLRREVRSLRNRASRLLDLALQLGLRATSAAMESPAQGDLVIATRLALLEQPEFSDPERVRDLFGALEQKERLVDLLEEMLDADGVLVALGDELDREGLAGCALVAAPFADASGLLGVIGPTRMDYARIIPLVGYCSKLVTDKLSS